MWARALFNPPAIISIASPALVRGVAAGFVVFWERRASRGLDVHPVRRMYYYKGVQKIIVDSGTMNSIVFLAASFWKWYFRQLAEARLERHVQPSTQQKPVKNLPLAKISAAFSRPRGSVLTGGNDRG